VWIVLGACAQQGAGGSRAYIGEGRPGGDNGWV
jgi:hypothetical protein